MSDGNSETDYMYYNRPMITIIMGPELHEITMGISNI